MSQLEVDKIIPQSGTTLTIGDSGDTITVASGATLTGDLNADNLTSGTVPSARLGTITNFTSTGIDDNATSTALTINGANNATFSGIVTAAEFNGGSLHSTINTSSVTVAGGTNSNVGANIGVYGGNHSSLANVVRFRAGSSETMRIDSSGNLLVGKSLSNSSTAGAEFRPDGVSIFGRDGNTPVLVNRKTSDGKIISVRKDNTEVGSIGVHNTRITIGNQDTGLKFNSGIDSIFPFDLSIEANRDNAVDLGWSSARFRDLYLGGGAYIGGTGTANKLDDYEEGTWTPSYGFTGGGSVTMSSQEGHYVKIGKLVIATVGMSTSALSSPSGNAKIQGLPFTKEAISESGFSKGLVYKWGTNFNNFGTVVIDSTSYALIYTSAFNQTQTYAVEGSDFITGAGSNRIIGVITYYTTS